MDDRLCHSLNHRAVLQLFRASHGLKISAAGIADIQSASAEDLVRIVSYHGIAPMIADGLVRLEENQLGIDRDLRIFFQEIREGNRLRNRKMKAQLTEAAVILAEENIPVVVLKGGCELVQPSYQEVYKRFMADLDLLIPETSIMQAVAALESNGYINPYLDDEFFVSAEHHDAPLVNERWPAAIEIHHKIGGTSGEQLLPTHQIFKTAEETAIANVMVPSRLNRLIHMMFHGQIQHSGFQDRLVSLRNIADMAALIVDQNHIHSARHPFQTAGLQSHFDGLLAATDLILPGLHPSFDYSEDAEQWARTAIVRLGDPNRTSRELQTLKLKDWAWGFATDSDRRSIYLAKLFSSGGIRRMLGTLRKFRQY
ncbi:MAG: nucleotidyltransferase family protein [Gammaproteobacteria bacterium]|nr:nucleotidyltransferase family protein [Gammaproteobacteria bacterium]